MIFHDTTKFQNIKVKLNSRTWMKLKSSVVDIHMLSCLLFWKQSHLVINIACSLSALVRAIRDAGSPARDYKEVLISNKYLGGRAYNRNESTPRPRGASPPIQIIRLLGMCSSSSDLWIQECLLSRAGRWFWTEVWNNKTDGKTLEYGRKFQTEMPSACAPTWGWGANFTLTSIVTMRWGSHRRSTDNANNL